MRKFISFVLAFVFVAGICVSAPVTITANAANTEWSDGFEFVLNDDGTMYKIIGCNLLDVDHIEIPSEYKGIPVTRIDKDVFNNENLADGEDFSFTSISIPSSITSISYAFASLKNLKEVHITDLASWCNIDFAEDEYNEAYSNPLHFAENLYLNGELVTDLVIPEGVTKIKSLAFDGCKSITSVTIPASLTSIGEDAFSDCNSIKAVNITDISLWCGIDFANSLSNPLNKAKKLYLNGQLLTDIVIPKSTTKLEDYAFVNCEVLTSVTIPESLTSVGDSAFYNCTSISDVKIPGSVKNIGNRAFYGCTSLERIVLGEGIVNIGKETFYKSGSYKSVKIPDSVTFIGENAIGYKYDAWLDKAEKITDFTIYGGKNSAAQKYAIENEFNFVLIEPHTHKFVSEITKEPTCVEAGIKTFICSICTETYSEPISARGHIYDIVRITKEATCEEAGVKTFACICGDSYTQPIPASGHNYDSGKVTKEPTCAGAGVLTFACSCGDSYTQPIPALGHTYNSGTVTKKATCVEEGVLTFACTCGESYTQPIPALGHTYNSGTVTKKETCVEAGVLTFACSCGESYTQPIPALGHTYDEGTVTKIPTCEEEGVKTFVCFCGDVYTENIEATGHIWNSGSVTTKPTCLEKGEKTYVCTVCYGAKSELISATGHDFDTKFTVDKEPTHDEEGSKSRHCKYCDEKKDVTSIPRLEKIAPPEVLSITPGPDCVTIRWTEVPDAKEYLVFKLVQNDNGNHYYKNIATVDAKLREYTDKSVEDGVNYCYAIASVDSSSVISEYNEFVYTYHKLKNLSTPTVAVKNTDNGIQVDWNEIDNALYYDVYRREYDAKTKKWSGWKKIKKDLTETTYVDGTVIIGTNYRYTVRAINNSLKSGCASTDTLMFNVTPIVKVSNVSNGVTIKWSSVLNATGYKVYRSEYNTKTKKWSSWKSRTTQTATKTSWTDKNVKSGAKYRFTVRACYGDSIKSDYNKSGVKLIYLAQPTVKFSNTEKGIKVTWNKIDGAKNYTVYKSEYVDGKWTSWKNVGTCGNNIFGCIDISVKSGVTYRYTVKAANGKYKSSYVKPKGLLYLLQPTVKAKKVSNGINVSWNTVNGAIGYTVYRSEYNPKTKKWSGWTNLCTHFSETSDYTDQSAVKGVTYKYTVRAISGSSKSAYKASNSVKR